MGLMTSLAQGAPAGRVVKSTGAGLFGGDASVVGGLGVNLAALRTASGMLVSQGTAMKVAAVFACVAVRSRDVARCTPQVIRKDAVGNKTVVTDHELASLFAKPNLKQTWLEFAKQMNAAILLRGNAYAVKLRDWRGRVLQLIPVNPDLVQVLEAPDGSLFYSIARSGLWMMAVLRDQPVAVPEEDVLHVRDMSFNTLLGLSRIDLARDTIGLALAQEQQAARWTGNGARPAGVLQAKGKVSPEAAARLKAAWKRMYEGAENTGSTAVLEQGMEWKPMQLSSVDLDFLAQREFSVKDVARLFDMPLHKIGEMGDVPKATVAELNSSYVQTTVMGDAELWEQRLAMDWDLQDDGLTVRLDESALLRADPLTMMNFARFGLMSSLMSQNEGRLAIGYGPKTGNETGPDSLMAPTNLAPNGSDADGRAPDGAGRPADGQLPGDQVPTKALPATRLKAAESEVADGDDEPSDEDEADVSDVSDDDLRALFSGDLLDGVL